MSVLSGVQRLYYYIRLHNINKNVSDAVIPNVIRLPESESGEVVSTFELVGHSAIVYSSLFTVP